MNNTKSLFILSISNMLERTGFYLFMSVIFHYLMDERGYSASGAGSVYSVFYNSIFVFMIIMGVIGDFVNRRKIIIVGLSWIVLGYILLPIVSLSNALPLIIPLGLLSIGAGIFRPNILVELGDLYKNDIRGGAIGFVILYAFINVGALIAVSASTNIKVNFGLDGLFFLSAATTILALVLYYFFPVSAEPIHDSQINQIENNNNESANSQKPFQTHRSTEKYGLYKLFSLLFLLLMVPIFWIAYHQTGLTYSFYIRDNFHSSNFSFLTIMTYNPIAILIFSILAIFLLYFFAKIKNVLSIFLFIGIGMIVVAMGYFIPAYCSANISCNVTYMSALLPILIIALGETLIGPFLVLGFYHFSPAKVRGLFLGLYMAITALGNSLLFIYAIVYEKQGAASTFKSIVTHVLICAVSVFVFWFIMKKLTDKKEETSQK